MCKLEELNRLVQLWSIDKGLHKADSSKQMLKVVEEVGEVARALVRNNRDELVDGIGDVVVTLIILAQQNNLDIKECLQTAYDEIKDRSGKMIDGNFVKDSDLNE
ncbi:MAG: MazG-like family protein [Bacilli bacterium]